MNIRSFGKWLRILVGVRVGAFLLLSVAGAMTFWAFWTGPVQTENDAALVFCLSPAEVDGFIDAAVILGLAQYGAEETLKVAGQQLTLQDWRKKHGPHFKRTCEALFAARPQAASGGNDIPATLIVLLSVIVGAVLSPLVTGWIAAGTRRREQADALRSAAHAFVSATDTFIRGWTGPSGGARPPDQEVRVRRSELAAQLGYIMARRPRWTLVQQLRTKLSTGSLGEDMTRGWAGQDDATQERARDLKADLDSLETAIGVIAEALERPGRSHQALRARPADPQT